MATLVNQINNMDIYAARAEADANGNNIGTTYATKSELPDGVPAVTSGDNGKVLKATYSGGQGVYGWETDTSDLPDITGNAGKILAVNSGATGVEWVSQIQIGTTTV